MKKNMYVVLQTLLFGFFAVSGVMVAETDSALRIALFGIALMFASNIWQVNLEK